MTRQQAVERVIERMGVNEDASTDLLNALMEFPELIVENPKVAMAVMRLVSTRVETGRILEECKEVLESED